MVPVTVGGDTAIQITPSTGQPVGVGQWFGGYDTNAASATVSVSGSDGWVTIGDVFWAPDSEDVLICRVTTTGADSVLVDWTDVGFAT